MSAAQRSAVLQAAGEGRSLLIVDETLSDLALDGPVPPPLASGDPAPR